MLISKPYLQLQRQLHSDKENYGEVGNAAAPHVARIMNAHKVKELLDYGCGKGSLIKAIGEQRLVDHAFEYTGYDPAVERFEETPLPSEMVACCDVLEHIEPECLANVLDDLQRLTKKIGFFTVTCLPAVKILADGRNAHLIVKEPSWWVPKILSRFELQTFQKTESGFMVLVSPLYDQQNGEELDVV